MAAESIFDKKISKGKNPQPSEAAFFYAIVPDKMTKSVTFYFTRANTVEGRGLARGLSLFIWDYFKLDPSFFCDSCAITVALDSKWNYTERKFLSVEEKMEMYRLDQMEDEVNADPEIYISKDQQRVLRLDNYDEVLAKTRLTKGDVVPPPATTDDVSEMIDSMRESKLKHSRIVR